MPVPFGYREFSWKLSSLASFNIVKLIRVHGVDQL